MQHMRKFAPYVQMLSGQPNIGDVAQGAGVAAGMSIETNEYSPESGQRT